MSRRKIYLTAGSFLGVTTIYLLYSLVVVPWILPPLDLHAESGITDEERFLAQSGYQQQKEPLALLFDEDRWERKNPKILETPEGMFLFQEYRNLDDNKIEVKPCTILQLPADPELSRDERYRQAIVLEANNRAVLEFSNMMNLQEGNFGQFIGGELIGEVTIRSDMEDPGPQDDLFVVGRDVSFTENSILSRSAVDLRLGKNVGRGSYLIIELEPEDPKDPQGSKTLKKLELRKLHRLKLAMDAKDPPTEPASPADANPLVDDPASGTTVEITCNGYFEFNPSTDPSAGRWMARFQEDVDVLRVNPDGPFDQLNCQDLAIFFGEPESETDASDVAPADEEETEDDQLDGFFDMKPTRMVASGSPVKVRAPQHDFLAAGEQLVYDFKSEQVILQGSRPVELKHKDYRLRSEIVRYILGASGTMGVVEAAGVGNIEGRFGGETPRVFHADWTDLLKVEPDPEDPNERKISILGQVALQVESLGEMNAEEAFIWCREKAASDDDAASPRSEKNSLIPDRALVRQDVHFTSPRGTCDVERLEIWFQDADFPEPVRTTLQPLPPWPGNKKDPMVLVPRHVLAQQQDSPWRPSPSSGAPPASSPPREGTAVGMHYSRNANPGRLREDGFRFSELFDPSGDSETSSQYEVHGALMRLGVDQVGKKAKVRQMWISGDVRIHETRTKTPDQRPITITGNQVVVHELQSEKTTIEILGQPAVFEGRGMKLTGTNINVSRPENRLWTNGPGRLDAILKPEDLPQRRPSKTVPLGEDETVILQWKKGMNFDGKVVSFRENVRATHQFRFLRCRELKIHLVERMDFFQNGSTQQAEAEWIECLGKVFIENHQFEGNIQVSRDRVEFDQIKLNLLNGGFLATGPGKMVSTFRRNADPEKLGLVGQLAMPHQKDSRQEDLSYLDVRFHDRLSGNYKLREAIAYGQIQCVYGPVRAWDETIDADDLASVTERGVLLHCNELSVHEMIDPVTYQRNAELIASGNTVIEGDRYTARADRVKYAQGKDLIILEGNGFVDAVLYRQQYVGGPMEETSARKIEYKPETNDIRINGARSSEMSLF
jgi:lipopolysaccharide export system protein LptA